MGKLRRETGIKTFQALGKDRCVYYVIKFVVSDDEQKEKYSPFQQSIRDWLNSDGTLGEGVVTNDVSRGAFY